MSRLFKRIFLLVFAMFFSFGYGTGKCGELYPLDLPSQKNNGQSTIQRPERSEQAAPYNNPAYDRFERNLKRMSIAEKKELEKTLKEKIGRAGSKKERDYYGAFLDVLKRNNGRQR